MRLWKKILLFQMEQEEPIKKIDSNMKNRTISVLSETFTTTIANLVSGSGEENEEKYTGLLPDGSLLLFCNVTDKYMDKMLFELRSSKIPVTYKAVLTDTNKNWNVLRLFQEMEFEKKYTKAEDNKLIYIKSNQSKIRLLYFLPRSGR